MEVLYELANGAPVHMVFSETTGLSRGNDTWIFGSEGTIHLDNAQNIFVGRRGDRELAAYPNPPEKSFGTAWKRNSSTRSAARAGQR